MPSLLLVFLVELPDAKIAVCGAAYENFLLVAHAFEICGRALAEVGTADTGVLAKKCANGASMLLERAVIPVQGADEVLLARCVEIAQL